MKAGHYEAEEYKNFKDQVKDGVFHKKNKLLIQGGKSITLLYKVKTQREPCQASKENQSISKQYFTKRKVTIRVLHSNKTVAT